MISFYAFPDHGEAASLVFRWNLARDKLGYVPTRNLDANHCEFYADGTLGRIFAHTGAYNNTLQFYFHVDQESLVEGKDGHILNLAAYVREPEDDYLVKAKDDKLSLCLAVQVPFQVPYSEVIEFAFFLDVKRADGSIDRLWLKTVSITSRSVIFVISPFRGLPWVQGRSTTWLRILHSSTRRKRAEGNQLQTAGGLFSGAMGSMLAGPATRVEYNIWQPA